MAAGERVLVISNWAVRRLAVGCSDWLDLACLLSNLDFTNHSNVSMCQFGVGDWHFAMQYITPRYEVLSQPHHSVDIMAVERAAQGFRRGRAVALLFPPAVQVGDAFALVQTVYIHLVHARAGGFDSDHLHSPMQIVRELESEVKELQDQIFFWRPIVLCCDFFDSKWVDRRGLGVTAIPANEDILSRSTLSHISAVSPGEVNPGPE